MQKALFSVLIFALIHIPISYSQTFSEVRSNLQDQKEVFVTIYNDNLALIKDRRNINLKPGLNQLEFRDVSALMRPETALLHSLTVSGSLMTLEQNFDFDLLTPQKLLEKYIGKTVQIVRTHPTSGEETYQAANVLSTNNGVVLRVGDHIETGVPGRLVFPDVPETLRDRPTLVMTLDNLSNNAQDLELSYLTAGLGWKADYVAELNTKDDHLDLAGWVTISNTSGSAYNNAKLQLIAGDVNRVQDTLVPMTAKASLRMEGVVQAQAPMREEGLSDYHLYTLERPTSIAENQTKQVALLSASEVVVHKQYLLMGSDYYYQGIYPDLGQKIKVGSFIEFENRERDHLGVPLPKGIIRVYKKDKNGNVQFIGEDNIDHTPKNETVKLKLGDAFDITADKKQTDFKKLASTPKYSNVYESAYEIIIKNAKTEKVIVSVKEPILGDWKILSSNREFQKESAHIATWQLEVPAEGKTTLNFRVQTRY